MLNKIKELLTSNSVYEENELLKEALDNANKANEEYKKTINELIERVGEDDAENLRLKDELDKYKKLLDNEVNAYNDLLKEINGISRQFVSKQFHRSPDKPITTTAQEKPKVDPNLFHIVDNVEWVSV